MHSFRKSQTNVNYLIHTMFPESVTLCWDNVEGSTVVNIHYFGHLFDDDTEFCYVNDTWWKIEYRHSEYHDGYGNMDYITSLKSVVQVDSPEGAIYDYTVSHRRDVRDGVFSPLDWK